MEKYEEKARKKLRNGSFVYDTGDFGSGKKTFIRA